MLDSLSNTSDEKNLSNDDQIMEAIICEGKNGEVDATIKYLQRMFEKRTPAVPVARLGG